MVMCREDERLKGGLYPKSCPTCKFGPCQKGHDWGRNAVAVLPEPEPAPVEKPRRAFVTTTWQHADAMRQRLPEDWFVVPIGAALTGRVFDDVVVVEDFSLPEYKSTKWMEQRRSWFETFRTRMAPGATGVWLTAPPK